MHRCARRRPTARAIGSVLAALVAALAIAGCGGSDDAPKLTGITDIKHPNAPAVALPAYGEGLKGEVRKLRPKSGKLMIVYFGYTTCPDVCPTTLAGLGVAMRSLTPQQRSQLSIGMVTADPKRDSGKGLVEYVGHFFKDQPIYGFRTTDMALLKKSETAFGAASEIDPHKPGENYTVTHTGFLYAVDRSGNVAVMWPFGSLSEEIAADLKVLIPEQSDPSKTTS